MKRKNISADTALLEVARRHNTTVDEVRKEIRIAMAVFGSGKNSHYGPGKISQM